MFQFKIKTKYKKFELIEIKNQLNLCNRKKLNSIGKNDYESMKYH